MPRLRPSGGYRKLRSFQVATIVYDATWWFCEKFLDSRSRMTDQMVQAARSGRQNIAEGSRASAVSSQTELRLMNVARASLEELLLDYEDFLRHRRMHRWGAESHEAQEVRGISRYQSDRLDQSDEERAGAYAQWLESDDPAVRANAIICLIHQANYLLDRQISSLEQQFINEGGYSEHLAAVRLAKRRADQRGGEELPTAKASAPFCPKCGKPMVLRTSSRGSGTGGQFWGCSGYPECRETAPV